MTNQSREPISNFIVKLNMNILGLSVEQDFPSITLMPD
jgi:hypothetical protein